MSNKPTIYDGGPAFPCVDHMGDGPQGMTLRDWLAGQVLPECLRSMSESVSEGVNCKSVHEIPEQVAIDAYIIADAMIAAREGRAP